MARRDDREYREYLSEEQRSQRGCIARRMQPDFRHGLLERTIRIGASACGLSDGCPADRSKERVGPDVRHEDVASVVAG